MKKKAVFLDRDGVINEVIYHEEIGIIDSPFTLEQFEMFPDVGKAIDNFHKQGFLVIIVSNQPGISKYHFSEETFEKIKEKMRKELSKEGVKVDGEYYCFHHPDAKITKYKAICECRKPKPGMILMAAKDFDIDLKNSWMIGDALSDIVAGKKAGCKTILIGRMKCDMCKYIKEQDAEPDFISPNLYKASLITQAERT